MWENLGTCSLKINPLNFMTKSWSLVDFVILIHWGGWMNQAGNLPIIIEKVKRKKGLFIFT